ncbi:Protein of unknown function [Lactobacillus delbrueckii subsp. lactis]|jgi:hypothetical protein
MNY